MITNKLTDKISKHNYIHSTWEILTSFLDANSFGFRGGQVREAPKSMRASHDYTFIQL